MAGDDSNDVQALCTQMQDLMQDLESDCKEAQTRRSADAGDNAPDCVCPSFPIYMMPVCCPCYPSTGVKASGSDGSLSTDPEDDVEDPFSRQRNFYNNYNHDWRKPYKFKYHKRQTFNFKESVIKNKGQTLDGENPICDEATRNRILGGRIRDSDDKKDIPNKGVCCPVGARVNMVAGDDCSKWCAKVKFEPKPKIEEQKQKGSSSRDEKCTAKVYQGYLGYKADPNIDPCLYGAPCKAHCFNTPPEMRHIDFQFD